MIIAVYKNQIIVCTYLLPCLYIYVESYLLFPKAISVKIYVFIKYLQKDELELETYNLFVTSKNETTNSPIHEFKVL